MKFTLSRGELANPVWMKLEEHLKAKLADLRLQNDDPSGTDTDVKTARRRGRIAELKELLDLGKPVQ